MYGEGVGTILVSGSNSSGYLISSTNNTTGKTDYHPTRIFHVTLLSWGTSSSTLNIYNGQNGTLELVVGGSTAGLVGEGRVPVDVDYGHFGQSFSKGAYYVADGNIATAAIVCKEDLI